MAASSASRSVIWSLLCGIAFLPRDHIIALSIPKNTDVEKWTLDIGLEAYKFGNRKTNAGGLRKDYENQSVNTVAWQDVISETKNGMNSFFAHKVGALKKLVVKAEEAYCEHAYNKKLELSDIDYPKSKNLDQFLNKTGLSVQYSPIFKKAVNFNGSAIHVPTDVYDGAPDIVNGISWTESLNEVFVENWRDAGEHSFAWQYFGSDKGFLRTYPASTWTISDQKQVDLYDARRRPWYIHGATSPKDVIVLIDASGSMHGVPMRIAQLAAQAMIDTLDDNDFFNIIYFNITARILLCPESKQLLQATKRNKLYAKNKLEGIKGTEVANWEKGMQKAFSLLNEARNGSECQKAVMVFSDGGTATLTKFFNENNSDKKIRVFTYPVGPPAESTVAMNKMACENQGYFTRIQNIGAVREVSENYVRVMTRPNAMSTNSSREVVWTAVYLDAMGLGMMITGTMPAFYRPRDNVECDINNKDDNSHLLGVMGIDVPLEYLNQYVLPPLIGPNGYVFALDNNGKIVLHPRLKTVFGYLPDPPGVDLRDIEMPVESSELLKLRQGMISRTPQSVNPETTLGITSLELYDLSRNELRVVKRTMDVSYAGIEGTPFSLGIATPQLGFRYETDLNQSTILGKLLPFLEKPGVIIESWPYCRSVTFAEDPVAELIRMAITYPNGSEECNTDMLYGLLVDLQVTPEIDVEGVFVLTNWGLTRRKNVSAGRIKAFPFQEIYGRVAASANETITYMTPFTSAKSSQGISVVYGFQKVIVKGHTVAVAGYEMDTTEFYRNMTSKHEDFYCYLLDENGFVVASNEYGPESSGKFFGRVDKYVMKELINETARDPATAIYSRIVFNDAQAACAERTSDNSAGTSITGPLFSVSSYFKWWSTKAAWSLLYFNLYSYLFSETSSFSEAAENVSRNRSCVKEVTAYYVSRLNVTQNGTANCGDEDGTRDFVVSTVPHSNLHLVIFEASGCGNNAGGDHKLKMAGEPVEADATSTDFDCDQLGDRRRPKRCFNSVDPEGDFDCGSGSRLSPHILLGHVFCAMLVTWLVGVQ